MLNYFIDNEKNTGIPRSLSLYSLFDNDRFYDFRFTSLQIWLRRIGD
jgi:hypothetical protein